jgi:hypothetical protein
MFIKINANGQVHPWLDTIQKASSWIMMLNSWAASSNKILELIHSLVNTHLWANFFMYCVYGIQFWFLGFTSRRGLRHTIGANSMSWLVQLLASHNKNLSFEIKLWLVLDSIFVFIHHLLSPFGTDVFF